MSIFTTEIDLTAVSWQTHYHECDCGREDLPCTDDCNEDEYGNYSMLDGCEYCDEDIYANLGRYQ